MLRIKYGSQYFSDPQLVIDFQALLGANGSTRAGWKEKWTIRDHITGNSVTEVNAAVNSWRALLVTDELDLVLEDSQGPTELQSMKAADVERGPRVVSCTLPEKGGDYGTTVYFEVVFEGFRAEAAEGIIDQRFTLKYEVDEGGLTTRTKEGELKTEFGTSAAGKLSSADPGTPPGYARVRETWSVDNEDVQLDYAFTDRELNPELPADTVEGHATTTTHTDNDGLQRVTVQGKFTGSGAAAAALNYKPSGQNIFICEQEIEPNDFDNSVRFRYVYRLNANDDPGDQEPNLIAFTETLLFRNGFNTTSFVTINYAGETPYKFVGGAQSYQAEQYGCAVGLDSYPDPADPLFASSHYSERPVITYHAPTLNADRQFIDWKVEWKYSYEFASASTVPGLLAYRPAKRTVFE